MLYFWTPSKFENVDGYQCSLCQPTLNITISQNIALTDEIEYYYIFDCPGEDAFSHWVYESFICLPHFLQIRDIYPQVKILTKNTKKYVNNYFKLFGVTNMIVNHISVPRNACFSHRFYH